MDCPQCKNEMKYSHKEWKTIAGWDLDYNDGYENLYRCKECKINYVETNEKEEWKIPINFQPTEKQIKTVMFIKNRIDDKHEELITKKQYTEYIGKYFEEAKKIKLEYEPYMCGCENILVQ